MAAPAFGVLGPLRVLRDGVPAGLGPLKQQLFLAALLTRPNAAVSADTLTEVLWEGCEPPRTARKNLQVHASVLRRELGLGDACGGRLTYGPGGYVLRVAPAECDALRFEELAAEARAAARAGHPARAARAYRAALELWRGDPLPELTPHSGVLRAAAGRWLERRLAVYEAWAEAQLEAGEPGPVADTAGEWVARHPLRERLRAAHITALHRTGRRAEALASFDECRQLLARELGLAPGAALTGSHRAVLADAAGGAPGPAGRRPGPLCLPPDLPDFTGREAELSAVLSALGRDDGAGRVVVVSGGPGTGKTALAVRAAHALGASAPDGRVAVALRTPAGAPRPWPAVLAELCRALGPAGPGPLPADPAEAAAAWRVWLAGRRLLLVLDDAPDEDAVRPLLPAAGPARALVTAVTRLPALEGAHRVELGPFTVAAALTLLGRLAGPARVAADPAAAARVVAEAGLLPLAVRICGNRLAVLRHLPLSRYAARLADPAQALDELACGGLSVRARLAAAWAGLAPPAREALLALGAALDGPEFGEVDVAGVWGGSAGRAARELERLVEAGVLEPPEAEVVAHGAGPGGRFRLPRLTWLWARERAAAPAAAGAARTPAPAGPPR